MKRAALAALLAALLAACESGEPAPGAQRIGHYATPGVANLPPQALPGGATTHVVLKPGTARSADAFSQPSSNLAASRRSEFMLGNSFFTGAWIVAPASAAARDGLGPLYTAAACQDCHIRDGRGHAPQDAEQTITAAVLRIALPDGRDHPHYGGHLQLRAIPGLEPEVRAQLHWIEHEVELADGSAVRLRRPDLRFDRWRYGPAGAASVGLRIAPPMLGLGLLEAIDEAEIEAQARRGRGRINRVRDRQTGALAPGRFGWKATQPSLRQQALDAFANDIGITSSLYPVAPCTAAQADCAALASGGAPELEARIEAAVVFYTRHLAPPARRDHERPEVIAGERLFHALGCAGCHRPQWITGDVADRPQLSAQTIFPYTDLLLHDMGPGLADGIREFDADGRHWRTPPLWGLGHTLTVSGAAAGYLHDGRARSLAEAILWHGGEAQAARDAWAALPGDERRLLIRFLASL